MSEELQALAKAIELRTGVSQSTIENIFENVAVFGYQVTKQRTHADVDLPNFATRQRNLESSLFPLGDK